jgi:hypothetical protein
MARFTQDDHDEVERLRVRQREMFPRDGRLLVYEAEPPLTITVGELLAWKQKGALANVG